jgi:hypothetical protein
MASSACQVTVDRRDRKYAVLVFVFRQTIPGRDAAVDSNLVTPFGKTNVIDRHIIMLAPEK